MFDSHIHLDQYSDKEIEMIIPQVEGYIAVATDLNSCRRLLDLKRRYSSVHIAAGFHPEQLLLSAVELNELTAWIRHHATDLCAIGEIGLPQYLRREGKVKDEAAYSHILEQLISLASELSLPVVLHAVYTDAPVALKLLEKYNVKGHFHWFKAADKDIQALLEAGHYVSVTPDILWNQKTERVAELTSINQLMIETDGPWLHTGFDKCDIQNELSAIIEKIADIKGIESAQLSKQFADNTRSFYGLEVYDENR